MEPYKKIEAGITVLNSGAALSNRNRRERDVFRASLRSTDKDEKRRGLVRAVSYGLLMGGAVALTLWGIATHQRVSNMKAFRESAQELAKAFEVRASWLEKAIKGEGQAGQVLRESPDITFSTQAIDPDTGIAGVKTQSKRGQKVEHKHGLIELLRGEVKSGETRIMRNKKGEPVAEFVTQAPLKRDVSWAQRIVDNISDTDDRIMALAKDMRSLLKNRGKGKVASDDLDRLIDYVEKTNLKRMIRNPETVGLLADGDDAFLKALVRKSNGEISMGKDLPGLTPDELLKLHGERTGYGRDFVDKTDAITRISDFSAQRIVKGLRDDLVGALQFRKRRAGNIMRFGDAEPEQVAKRYDIASLRSKAYEEAIDDVDDGIEQLMDPLGTKRSSFKLYTPEEMAAAKRTMLPPGYEQGFKYDSPVAKALGDNLDKRKAPLLDRSLSKKEKVRRVFRAVGELGRPTIKSQEGLRTAGVGLLATGSALGAAHMGAGLAANAAKGINDSWDDRNRRNRDNYEEAILRQRRQILMETGNTGYNQASLRHSVARARATEAESPNEVYVINSPVMTGVSRRININQTMMGRR